MRAFVAAAGVALAFVVTASSAPRVAAAATDVVRPNIVVVMVDDHPALDGRLERAMPEVSSVFVERGVTFADFHSETPLCCPARAGFLTGQHTHNHGVVTNHSRLFDPSMSIATQLDRAGYHTFIVGKYMNSYGRSSCKAVQNCAPTIPPGWDEWAVFGDPSYYDYDLWTGTAGESARPTGYGSDVDDYSTDVLARLGTELIRSAPRDVPIFAWVAPTAPHVPSTPAPRHRLTPCPVESWLPPNWNEADVTDKPGYVQAQPLLDRPLDLERFCRPLLAVDELVRGLRKALLDTGRLENTLLVYSGDNGMQMGEHRLPLKSAPYQTQIPFAISWPAALGTTRRTISARVQNIDLAPTLAEAAATALGPFPNGQSTPDGTSFLPLLLRQRSTLRRETVLSEMLTTWRGVPQWSAVTTTSQSPLAATGCAAAARGGCRWHYIEYASSEESELYDVSNGPCWSWSASEAGDPCELENAVKKRAYASVRAALAEELRRLRTGRGQSAPDDA